MHGWRERWRPERQRNRIEEAHTREVAKRLAALLRDRYGARRVVLGGSLATGDFRHGSDIDLAAEGVDPDVFFRAGADVEARAEGFRVDLVPIESATPAYRRLLEEQGVVLHDTSSA